MKKLIPVCALLAAGAVHAGFVYQTDRQFLTTGDLDGDGRSDLVVVDASNATLRVGYQLSANAYTWADPRPLGLDSVAGVACGNLLSTTREAVVATSPALNRINVYEAPSAAAVLSPVPAYGNGIGPFSVAAMDVGGSGNTAHDDLVAASMLNGSTAFGLELIRSDGSAFSPIANYAGPSGWSQLNEVLYAPGKSALCAVYAESYLCMYTVTNGYPEWVSYVSMPSLSAPRYAAMTLPSGEAHFLLWERGGSTIWNTTLEEVSPTNYQFSAVATISSGGAAIDDIFVLQGASSTRLAVVDTGGTALELYNYDANTGLSPIQTLYPPAGETFSGAIPVGLDDFVALSSVGGDAAPTANQMHFSGGQFVSLGSQTLASPNVSGQANVMTFENEPFVDPAPRRLQLLRAADWSDSAALGASVSATVEDDSGPEYGLVNPHSVSLGSPAAGAAFTLVNQLDDSISVCSLDAARGEEVVVVSVSPGSGEYGTSIEVSFTNNPTSATVFYRTDSSDDWTTYSAPFPVFKETEVQYYATYGGKSSIIRTVSYRFTDAPSDLDSDGDGVPDYVELANGLDPINSGLDADGDGSSDLEELIRGTDPLSTNVPPSRLETGALFDQILIPRPYDGVASAVSLCETGTQVRLYSAGGSLAGYAQATNLSPSVASTNPATFFSAQSENPEIPFLLSVSDQRFDIEGGGATNQLGVELVGIHLQPTSTVVQVNYEYAGGTLAQESANWIAAAQAAYAAQPRIVQEGDLGLDEVLAGLLVERKLADEVYSHGFSTNRWVSLFKGRTADTTMEGISVSGIQALETNSPAYSLRGLVENLQSNEASMVNLQVVAREVYSVCSDLGRDSSNAGKYPLPVDVLRTFIFDGTLQSNYLAAAPLPASELAAAAQEVGNALAAVPTRTWGSFTLTVRTNSFDGACPVLYNGGGQPKSLYTATGNPYRFPSTFQLGAGAEVQLTAYTDRDWNLCPGTDPLEVIALSLTALPAASLNDADGNLLPDDYEAMFLSGSGGLATSDLDGDGFGDLQEYLDGTDPGDPSSHGAVAVDLGAPVIQIDGSDLSIGWPTAYASSFVFIVEYTEDLPGTPFATEEELPEGTLDTVLDQTADHRFYRVKMRLR